MRCMDLCGSAIPFMYPFVESKDKDVDNGQRTNQALFKCDSMYVHLRTCAGCDRSSTELLAG